MKSGTPKISMMFFIGGRFGRRALENRHRIRPIHSKSDQKALGNTDSGVSRQVREAAIFILGIISQIHSR